MLDKTTSIVLSAINDQCDDNTYVILKNTDIKNKLPKKHKADDDALKETVNYLAKREFIKLKYSEEGTYCLTMLPKGRLFNEDKKEQRFKQRQENKRNRNFLLKISVVSAISAFLGALVAVYLLN
jgi:hypothetical protein